MNFPYPLEVSRDVDIKDQVQVTVLPEFFETHKKEVNYTTTIDGELILLEEDAMVDVTR